MKKHFTLSLLILVLVSACKSPPSRASYLEPLYSLTMGVGEITFEVKSHGCTEAGDFKIEISPANKINRLWIERIKSDRCRKMPEIVKITQRFDDGGVDHQQPIILENLLLMKPKKNRF